MTLALETTAEPAGVALLSGEELLDERKLGRGTRHGVELLPAVADLLRGQKKTPSDLSLVAVSLGPGSFTGIRIGLAAGRSLAHFAGARIVGVPTLDALAEEAPPGHPRIAVVIDAGRGEIYGAVFDLKSKVLRPEAGPAVLAAEEWAERISGPAWLVGDAPLRYPGLFEREGVVLAPPERYPPSPVTIGRLGRRAARSPSGGDEGLEPIYLRPPAAKTIREREEERAEG